MRFIVVFAVLAAASPLRGQEATVTGRVTNAQGQPEAGVVVRLLPDGSPVTTGTSGTYRLIVPRARIRAGQSLAVSASRGGLAARSGITRSAACDSLVFDIRMERRAPSEPARREGGIRLETEVLQRCARIREEGLVLRRADLRSSGEQDVLTTLGSVAGLRYSIGTAGGRPTLRIGGGSADRDPAVYVDGRPVELRALTRMRASEAEAIWVRPGNLPAREGEPAAPGGIVRVIRSSHGVSADSLLQRLDGFWWPPLPPRAQAGARDAASGPAVERARIANGGMLRRADLGGAGDGNLLISLSNAGAFRPAKVGGRPVKLIGADSTVTAEPVVYLDGVRVEMDALSRIRVSEVDSVEVRPSHLPARPGHASGPGGAILIWRAAAPRPRE